MSYTDYLPNKKVQIKPFLLSNKPNSDSFPINKISNLITATVIMNYDGMTILCPAFAEIL